MIQFLTLQVLKFFDFFHKKIIFFFEKNKILTLKLYLKIAHKGETIELYIKHFKIKKLYSFEPSYLSFNYLKRKINEFKIKNCKTKIVIENIALGKEIKQIKIKHMNESSSSTIKEINIDSKYFKKKQKLLFNFEIKNFFNELNYLPVNFR